MKVATCLMFEGKAPDALELYKQAFPDSPAHHEFSFLRPPSHYSWIWVMPLDDDGFSKRFGGCQTGSAFHCS
jgi:hypothetical protein